MYPTQPETSRLYFLALGITLHVLCPMRAGGIWSRRVTLALSSPWACRVHAVCVSGGIRALEY